MGKSKEQFIAQREFEIMGMDGRSLKKEAIQQAEKLLEFDDAESIYSKSVRLEKYLTEFNKTIKEKVSRCETFNNVEFSEGQRTTYNFKEDAEWSELNSKLKEREDLLKMRSKLGKDIFNENGESVTLVSTSTTSFIKANIK